MKITEKQLEKFCKKYRLSPRESQILKLIIDGVDSNAEIAKRLGVTLLSAKVYVHNLYAKVGVSSKVKLVVQAFQES